MTKQICWFLIGLSFLVRFAGIGEPLTGAFSTKQITCAMVAKNFAETGHNPLYPRTDWTVGGERGLEMTDMPFYYYVIGITAKVTHIPLDVLGRLFSILSTIGVIVFLFLIARFWYGSEIALMSITAFSLFPLTIVFGQSFQNDMFALFLFVAGLYSLSLAKQRERGWGEGVKFSNQPLPCPLPLKGEGNKQIFVALSALLVGLAIAHRPFLAPLVLPCFLLLRGPAFWIWAAGVFTLPFVWYLHSYLTGMEAMKSATSTFDQIAIRKFPDPILLNPDFYKGMFDQLTGIVFSPAGFAYLLLGILLISVTAGDLFMISALILAALPIIAVPGKFFDLPYYLLPTALPGAVFAGRFVAKFSEKTGKWISALCFSILMVCSLRYALPPIFAEHDMRQSVVRLGAEVDGLIPKEARIVVAGSGMDFMYYSKRKGNSFLVNLEAKANDGSITRRIALPKDEELVSRFEELRLKEKTDYFVIYDVEAFQRRADFSKHIETKYPAILKKENILVYQIKSQ